MTDKKDKIIKLLVIEDDKYFLPSVSRMMLAMNEENLSHGNICTGFEINTKTSDIQGRIELILSWKTKKAKLGKEQQ